MQNSLNLRVWLELTRREKTTIKLLMVHGTGLRPPTEEQWEKMKNQPILIDKIESYFGTTELPSSCDNSATIWFPPIGNQGSEGSCVSWACGTILKLFRKQENTTGIFPDVFGQMEIRVLRIKTKYLVQLLFIIW